MKLALFDLDHTLLDVDSDYLWGEYLIRNKLVNESEFRLKNQIFYEQYIAGTLDAREYNEFVADFLAQHGLDQLHAWRDDYINTDIKQNMRPKGIAAIKAHKESGHDVVIISATNDFIVHAVAKAFDVPHSHVIATRLEMLNNRYTGKVLGTPNFQAGKLTNLKAWLNARGAAVQESFAYSDSFNDLPLLEFADVPYAVTPDEKLKHHAQQLGWDILDWQLKPTAKN